jgi:thiol-disulfide isomerase/thioredoxin
MKRRVVAAITAATMANFIQAGSALAANEAAPQIHESLTQAPAAPYDEAADARNQVDAAIAHAAAAHKFVLIDFGGNWCPDCRVAAGVLAMDEVKPWIDRNFDVVFVDIGRMKKNLDIAARYGVKIVAVPTMVVVDPQGRMVNAGNPAALQDARGMSPQAIVDTINGWIHKPA